MERKIRKAMDLLSSGLSRDAVMKRLGGGEAEEAVEIALCRLKAKEEYTPWDRLYFDEEGLRYSTPELVAEYRSSVISGYDLITDVSAGVGIQAIFFGFTNKYVQGFDILPRRVRYARRNAKVYGVKNVNFFVVDALSEEGVRRASASDVIYSDPARPPQEDERRLETLSPPPLKIVDLYGRHVPRFVFDLPPQIQKSRVPPDWALEYISVGGRINRLTAYVGFDRPPRAAVSLPAGAHLVGEGGEAVTFTSSVEEYLYVVDEAVYYASLLAELQSKHPSLRYLTAARRRTLATSGAPINSPFLLPFSVVEVVPFQIDTIRKALVRCGAGKAVVRFSVAPEDYWKVRADLERGLEGQMEAHLFRVRDECVIATPIRNVV